ncbi:MAG: hypothetical protein CYG60_19840 [Actinobacteria bacterium]|nr:MAG: hypothetical protein CYG60_19840 [Actinomycetota bacterium]
MLAEDFGIPAATVLDALEGEPQKAAIAVCAWAAERTDDPTRALRCWAKKHNRGRCRAHRRGHRSSPGDSRDGIREQQDERRRGTTPARRRGVAGGLDAAWIRANVERMSS